MTPRATPVTQAGTRDPLGRHGAGVAQPRVPGSSFPLCANVQARHQGWISSWTDERGFGFITPNGGGERVFVHILAFAGRTPRPMQGDSVTYAIKRDSQERPEAQEVYCTGDHIPAPSTPKRLRGASTVPTACAGVVAALFLTVVAALVRVRRLPITILGVYVAASMVAFGTYLHDKKAARAARWRTSESSLHLLGLFGGWPGALVARHVFRHKTRKESFIILFWVTVALNCWVMGWLASPKGRRFLAHLVSAG